MNVATQLLVKVDSALLASGLAPVSVPDPTPVAPPGAEGLLTVLNWVLWIAFAAGVLGFIVVGIMMMLSSSGRMGGGGGEHMGRLGWVMAGCIVAAAASLLARTFI